MRGHAAVTRRVSGGSAVAAGVLTTLVGGVLGILGFIDYAQEIASAINDLALTTPGVSATTV